MKKNLSIFLIMTSLSMAAEIDVLTCIFFNGNGSAYNELTCEEPQFNNKKTSMKELYKAGWHYVGNFHPELLGGSKWNSTQSLAVLVFEREVKKNK